MQLRRLQGASSGILVAAITFAVSLSSATAAGKATFTSAQAGSGAKEYAKSCAACHGARLQGTSAPSLKGKTSGIAQQSVAQVYAYVSQQMPLTKPGGLSPAQYANIMAFVLKQNGHPPGPKKLTADAARADKDMLNP